MAESDESFNASVQSDSEITYEFYCEPCSTENLQIEATGFCEQCVEYLCENCCRYHSKASFSRTHVLLDKVTMPKIKTTPKVKDILTEMCPKHKDRVLEYFCNNHNELCCSVCTNTSHKTCTHMSYVPEISNATANGEEYKQLIIKLNHFVSMVTSEQRKFQLAGKNNNSYLDEAVANIKAFRKSMDIVLDKIVDEAIQSVTTLHKENSDELTLAMQKHQTVLSNVQTLITDLDDNAKANMNNRLFVEMKLTGHRISAVEDEIEDAATDFRHISYRKFDQVADVQSLVSALSGILYLSISRNGVDIKTRYLHEVLVKTQADIENCNINGIAVVNNDIIVVTDSSNNTVKRVNVNAYVSKVSDTMGIHTMPLSSKPLCVINTTPRQVAVSLGKERRIQIISVTRVLSKTKTIEIPGDNFAGICYDGQRFIILYPQPRCSVKVVGMSGAVLRTLFTDNGSNPLLQNPGRIAFSQEQDATIYITDSKSNTVMRMAFTDKSLSVNRRDWIISPKGIVVGRKGVVYVCSGESVHQLSGKEKHVLVQLDPRRGLTKAPHEIAYGCDNNTLYISSGGIAPWRRNYVRLYKLI